MPMYKALHRLVTCCCSSPSICFYEHLGLGDIELHFLSSLARWLPVRCQRALRKLKTEKGSGSLFVTVAGGHSRCCGNGVIPDEQLGQRQHPLVEWHVFSRSRPSSLSAFKSAAAGQLTGCGICSF